MKPSNLWRHLREGIERLVGWIRPATNYMVTVCLGAAGILFARTFPSSNINEFVPQMFMASVFFFLMGLLLKILSSREDAG